MSLFKMLLIGILYFVCANVFAQGDRACVKVANEVCDRADLNDAYRAGMPSFVKVAELLKKNHAQVHTHLSRASHLIAVRGTPIVQFSSAMVALETRLQANGYIIGADEQGPRVFTTRNNQQMIIIEEHANNGQSQVSIAYWTDQVPFETEMTEKMARAHSHYRQ